MNKKEAEYLHELKMQELAYERETKLLCIEYKWNLENQPQQPQQQYYPQQQYQPQPMQQIQPQPQQPVFREKYHKPEVIESDSEVLTPQEEEIKKSRAKYGGKTK